MVGGGYGVAPLSYLAREALAVGCLVTACIGARTAADVLLADSLRQAGARVATVTEDGSDGTRGMVTDVVETLIARTRFSRVYGCGPVGMLEALERQCLANELPYQLSWEARMRCGMGLCGACEVHGRSAGLSGSVSSGWLACHDGPVAVREALDDPDVMCPRSHHCVGDVVLQVGPPTQTIA